MKETKGIDLYLLWTDVQREIRKIWWVLPVLCMVIVGITYLYTRMTYEPQYRSASNFTVSVRTGRSEGDSTYGFYYSEATAEQLGQLFPTLLQSDAMQELIKDDLMLEEMPGTLGVSVVTDSNLVTMFATADDPKMAQTLLNSAMKCFPEISYYVIGETRFQVLQEAMLPSGPYRTAGYLQNIVWNVILVILGFVAFLPIYALMRKTINSEQQCEDVLHMEVIGRIPQVNLKKREICGNQTIDVQNEKVGIPFREAMGSLALQVEWIMQEAGKQSLMVTSTLVGEGKSTIAWNLAECMAEHGKKILLVDLDFKNQCLAQLAGNSKPYGLPEIMEGKISEKEAIYQCGDEKLYVLGGVDSYQESLVLLHSEQFAQWLEQKKQEYDYVILDAGTCGIMADATAVAEQSDGLLYVIHQDKVKQKQIKYGLDKVLRHKDAQFTGVILNGITVMQSGYQKYYYGSYGTKKKDK